MRGGLKVLSGKDVVAILAGFGFFTVGGTKHFKVRRTTPGGDETLIVPNHDPIAKGTLHAIFSQASRYVPQVNEEWGEWGQAPFIAFAGGQPPVVWRPVHNGELFSQPMPPCHRAPLCSPRYESSEVPPTVLVY